jgi:hypothetical protein
MSTTTTSPAPEAPQDRTIFVLYVPGGAMLNLIPYLVLNHLEKITECPTTELFQVFDAVSGGTLPVVGLNMRDPQNPAQPKLTGHDGFELFCKHGPRYFPQIPGRMAKMWTANALNIFKDYVDPLEADELAIDELQDIFKELSQKAPWEYRDRIKRLEEIAISRWVTKKSQKEALQICEELDDISDEIDQLTDKIGELVFLRTSSSCLGIVFKKSALGIADMVLKHYANNYMFDPTVPKEIYQGILGENRLSDTIRSVYVSAYDIKTGKVKTFFSRKQDFFSTAPDNPTVTSEHNNKLWDIILASTANPFAFPPHVTEDGTVCTDKAPVHTPLTCIQDVLDHKPADAKVKLIVLGTGRYITKSSKMDDDTVKERYIKYGVAGNLVKGREIAELEHYVMSTMRDTIRQRIGNENIIEISPRMSPHTKTELMKFPSTDIMNASKENIEKIVQRAQDLIVEEDVAIRELAQMLVDNVYNLGRMDREKYVRVSERLGIRTTHEDVAEEHDDQKDIVDRNVPPGPGPLKRAFMFVTNMIRPTPKPPSGPAPRP